MCTVLLSFAFCVLLHKLNTGLAWALWVGYIKGKKEKRLKEQMTVRAVEVGGTPPCSEITKTHSWAMWRGFVAASQSTGLNGHQLLNQHISVFVVSFVLLNNHLIITHLIYIFLPQCCFCSFVQKQLWHSDTVCAGVVLNYYNCYWQQNEKLEILIKKNTLDIVLFLYFFLVQVNR